MSHTTCGTTCGTIYVSHTTCGTTCGTRNSGVVIRGSVVLIRVAWLVAGYDLAPGGGGVGGARELDS